MYKFFVIVFVLVLAMTGCSAESKGFLFNRQEYIESLVDKKSAAAYDAPVAKDIAANTSTAEAAMTSGGNVENTTVNSTHTNTIRKNLITNFALMGGLNAIRAEHGLSQLQSNQELERCAHIRAKEASYQYCHYRPDGSPCTSVSELADGEILVTGPWNSSLDDLLASWINSPPHRASILKACDMEAGAGVYYNYDEQTVCWAVLFHIV